MTVPKNLLIRLQSHADSLEYLSYLKKNPAFKNVKLGLAGSCRQGINRSDSAVDIIVKFGDTDSNEDILELYRIISREICNRVDILDFDSMNKQDIELDSTLVAFDLPTNSINKNILKDVQWVN